jgi:hypothetical protein
LNVKRCGEAIILDRTSMWRTGDMEGGIWLTGYAAGDASSAITTDLLYLD